MKNVIKPVMATVMDYEATMANLAAAREKANITWPAISSVLGYESTALLKRIKNKTLRMDDFLLLCSLVNAEPGEIMVCDQKQLHMEVKVLNGAKNGKN